MGKQRTKPKLNLPRRQFLGMLGASVAATTIPGPVQMLISSLVDGLNMKAQAQAVTGALPARNYVYLNLPGGPPRWVWDMPLIPYKSESLIANPHVATRFISSTQSSYVTSAITRNGVTLNMPSLWNENIPTASGGQVPMASLLDNMLMIRGVKMPSDGHTNNNYKSLRPINSSPSLHGAVADRSLTPVPAINLPGGYGEAYMSRKGIAQGNLGDYGGDPLRSLLSPFDNSGDGLDANVMSRQSALDVAIASALLDLKTQASLASPGAETLYDMRSQAEKLLRQGIGDLSSVYTNLYNKYAGLIRAVGSLTIDGVTNVPISLGSLSKTSGGVISQTQTYDGYFLGPNANLGQIISANTTISLLAESFAVAEYLIVNGYSSSINMCAQGVGNLNFQDAYKLTTDANGNPISGGSIGNQIGDWAHDEHTGGSFCSLVINSFHFKAISACLYEFISTLKSANLFSETVIQIGGEFSRSARGDNTGSDHGWTSHVTSLLSGAISKPMVVGNTLFDCSQAQSGNYPGSWGSAAPVMVDGVPQELTIGHETSTVAELLRVEHPMPNNGSLVIESNGGIINSVELATNK